ncbi:MAG: rhomboid family intramembrane serine protease [Candidatus Aenigmarchaeota archaeon]|nr:rhomboid family intramembrane serine protease [Candidatus Aenigmarchaeota archaeon]
MIFFKKKPEAIIEIEKNIETKKKKKFFKIPYVTIALMILILITYGWQNYYYYSEGKWLTRDKFNDLGFSLDNVLAGKLHVFATSIFLHAGPDHIILNLLALLFFGKAVEETLGWKKMLLVFFSAAIVGNLAVLSAILLGLMPAGAVTIGASGAIFGLLGVAMLVDPLEIVIYPYVIPVPLILVAVMYTIYNIGAFVSTVLTGTATDIAYVAHIGGLIAGMLIGFKLEGKRKGFISILLILLTLILIPVFWETLQYLESYNYIQLFAEAFA